jgi:hypothetical protein
MGGGGSVPGRKKLKYPHYNPHGAALQITYGPSEEAPMKLAVTVVKTLVVAGSLYLLFRYAAEFSLRQSIALTALGELVWGLFVYGSAARYVEPTFKPFYVRVMPNWLELLRDQNLIKDEKDWQTLYAGVEGRPPSEYSALRSGIMLTVLRTEPRSFLPALVYSNNHRTFATEVHVCEPISDRFDPLGPEIYLKWGVNGYELGITVVHIERGGLEPRKRLVIAILPYEEFCFYWYTPQFVAQHWEKLRKRRDQLLAENGWTRAQSGYSEICLEHKYFRVFHNSI